MRWLVVGAMATVLAGCSGAAGSAIRAESGETTRRDRNVLLRSELSEGQQAELSVYDAIRLSRPHMLRIAAPSSLRGSDAALVVYVDETLFGGVNALQQFRMLNVERVEYFSGPEATTRYGTDHGAGAIVIRLRR